MRELVGDAVTLDDDKPVLRAYYAGTRIPSPNGGFFIPLGIRPMDDGSALLFLEFSASSLRYWAVVPKVTRTERKKVRDLLNEGVDPDCPRHGDRQRLVRVGRDLVCPLCGVAYARV
ncbi:MAG: hypothetical protein RJQ04_15035 [Longimicrobiales bacterium]